MVGALKTRVLRDRVTEDTPELVQQPQPPSWYEPPKAGYDDRGQPGQADERWRYETAGFGIRAGARIVDNIVGLVLGFIAGVVGAVVVGILAAMGVVQGDWETRIGSESGGGFLLSALGGLAYHAISEGLGGASVGKLVCGLRTIGTDGRPCSFASALKRSIAFYVDGLFFGLVAYSAMSKSPLKQRIGDRWASTAVVRGAAVPQTATRGAAGGIVAGAIAWAALLALSTVLKCL